MRSKLKMKQYFIKTFGCAMNQADSEKINMILLQSGFIKLKNWENADLIIFNTCSVRQKWEDRVFWLINEIIKEKLKIKNWDWNNITKLVIWITWCMVRKTWLNTKYLQLLKERKRAKKIELLSNLDDIFNNDDKLFPRISKLDFTFRIEEIKYLPLILSNIYKENIWNDYLFNDYLKLKQLRENSFSASVIIQTWCDNYCSYCIVPHTRWKEISRDENEILAEINEVVNTWTKEIILIWQNVNSYWKQFWLNKYWSQEEWKWKILYSKPLLWKNNIQEVFKSPFRNLLEQIDKIKWIERIRFVSSNPHDMTQDILDVHFDLKNTCNYLHFALQSWSNIMLKKMNRKHSYEDFKNIVLYLRSRDPLFAISTDIIVWYSWETEEMFEETLKAVRECEFDFIFNSRYSVRNGTIASKIYPDDVPEKIKAERWHKLNDLLKKNVIKRNTLMIWKTEKVLINQIKNWNYIWRTRNFKEVYFTSDEKLNIWDLINVKLEKVDNFIIIGKKV